MRFEPPRPPNQDERILPLINVVFLLLIFFMLAGQLAATDVFTIEPPQSLSEGKGDPGQLVVLVAADGRLAVAGEAIDAAQLLPRLQAALAEDAQVRVYIKADAEASSVEVVKVMEVLRQAGAQRVHLITRAGGA